MLTGPLRPDRRLTKEPTMNAQPIQDRSTAQQLIRQQLDQLAQEHGYRDRIDELDHDYEEWRGRAGLA